MKRWKHFFGLDRAIAYTSLARGVSIAGSVGTVLLIVRFLNPIEQGYYYTLWSLVALQLVFEMGFSFVVQQLAAHECIHLTIEADGKVSGEEKAHARLASALQLSVRWYTFAALIMGVVLLPLGSLFFARHAAGARVDWMGPWIFAVAASMAGLWCMPFYSFLEGCGQVRQVAALRLRQAAVSALLSWTALLLHRGLYAPGLVIMGQAGTGLAFMALHRRFLIGLFKTPAGDAGIHWSREVLPFQWRLAVSWMGAYFSVQVLVPLLFTMRGAVEAGQMGMSLSITGYMTALVLPWVATKATPFGNMIARGEFEKLDRLFLRTLVQATGAFTVLALVAGSAVALLPLVLPRIAARMVGPGLFALLLLAAGANCVTQNLATLLRSFKREPFLAQSIAVAMLTLILVAVTAQHWGNAGATMSYLVATGGVGLPVAIAIFLHTRGRYLTAKCADLCEGAV